MVPPAADEIEISLFGPGYGESVAVHLGTGQWAIIDSCRDEATGRVAPLEYLSELGIDPTTSVRLLMATHWHDDHIRGLSEVLRVCSGAKFVCSAALNEKEFVAMVTRYEARNTIAAGSGVREIFEVLKHLADTHRQPFFAAPDRPIFRCREAESVAGGPCIVTTLSPSDKQFQLFWADVAALMPSVKQTKRRATTRSPNHIAVAIWIAAGTEAILLGSDLEETSDPATGWSVIVESKERPTGTASVFKIPHHGSKTAHSDAVWDSMVATGAYAILTPFVKGNVSLPKSNDVTRILGRTKQAYASSDNQRRAVNRRDPAVEKTIRETVGRIKAAQAKMGHIRLRKKFGAKDGWMIELRGNASQL